MEKGEISLNDIDSEKLHEHFSFKVDIGQNPLRIDKFLMLRIENATRNKIQKAALNGSIRVNDLPVKSSYKVKGGEVIKVLFNRPPHENLLIPEKMKIDVVYEDDDLIVVNKPPNIVVHPGHGNYSGTLINGLLSHFERLPKNSNNRPGLVHRIDKDTSGLIVVAKTEQAMVDLSKQFYEKKSKRKYIALVWGDLKSEEGKIEGSNHHSIIPLGAETAPGIVPSSRRSRKSRISIKIAEPSDISLLTSSTDSSSISDFAFLTRSLIEVRCMITM